MTVRLRILALIATTMAAPAHAEDIMLYAAGSLRAPLTALARAYTVATGTGVTSVFGASGLLRERIAAGERADVFASAADFARYVLSADGQRVLAEHGFDPP